MADRRTFLAGMLAAGLLPKPTWADAGNPAFLSAGLRQDGKYVLCGLDTQGQISFQIDLPERGHAAAGHPTKPVAVTFARRPGTFAIVVDCMTGDKLAELDVPQGRHFYGHGVFSPEGDILFTTENDFETARGMIGVWDVPSGYQRIGEFPSGGIGPHDMKLIPDGQRLIVANGGIETHPDSGRTKLNIPTMRPNISVLRLDGSLVRSATLAPALHKNSLRHLAMAADGTVAVAMQWQGDITERPAVLGLMPPNGEIEILQASAAERQAVQGYAGSIAISNDGGEVAITSPQGGVCQVFSVATKRMLRQRQMLDVCGVAASGTGFLLTSGMGTVAPEGADPASLPAPHPVRWDNHLVSLTRRG